MKLALLFPGQGSQYMGMCVPLIKNSLGAARIFDRASAALGFDLAEMIANAPMKVLTKSENAQPAVVAASYTLFEAFIQETGVCPSYLIGHSLGEISALACSGSISFEDSITFARERGRLMQQALVDNMGFAGIVTDLSAEAVCRAVKRARRSGYVAITGYNSPEQTMVAGARKTFKSLEYEVDNAGGQLIPFKMIPMKADAPYHSHLMRYLVPEFVELIDKIEFKPPDYPIWSTVTGWRIKNANELRSALIMQITSPVLWNQVLGRIRNIGVDMIVDIGPNKIIRNLVKENAKMPNAYAYDDERDHRAIMNAINRNSFVQKIIKYDMAA